MGVGNVLLSDEGLGVHFIKSLSPNELPHNVEVLEGGTAGLELVHLIQDIDYLIVVDALNAQTVPGEIFRFKPQDLTIFPESFTVSFHQIGILEVLSVAAILGKQPDTVIFGVQPKSMDWGLELTPEVNQVLPRLKAYVLEEIREINLN